MKNIEVRNLRKTYGHHAAVDDLSFTVQPGRVTGFLGPNGAGKSTTMRMIMGLTRPDSGEARIGGRRYDTVRAPLHEVGALLDAGAVHPRRSAYHHLLALAQTNGIGKKRVTEVLGMVFLSSHLMSEMAVTADHLIVVGRGRLLADVAVADMTASSSLEDAYFAMTESAVEYPVRGAAA